MGLPIILGRSEADVLAQMGVALLQIKNDRRLTLDDVGRSIGRSREMVAQYIAGEAEMGVLVWARAVETWPELGEKMSGGRK